MRRALLIMTVVVAIAVGAAAALLATIVALYDVRTVDLLPLDVSARPGAVERVPRIIHQTWKTAELPERWRNVSESCRALHPTLCVQRCLRAELTDPASTAYGPTRTAESSSATTTPAS